MNPLTLHPQARLAIERAGELPDSLAPESLRGHYDRVRMPLQPARPLVARAETFSIETRSGAIDARFYAAHEVGHEAQPLLVYFHGGGWVLGSLEGYDTLCRRLAIASGWSVLSVGYRLAPEHKFPAAVEDAHDAVLWASAHADTLGIDGSRIAVGGDSAGANLSAVVSLLCAGPDDPTIAAQILIYGAFDLSCERESHERYASGYMLNRNALRWFISQYLSSENQKADWRASPLLAETLAGLPKALFIVAECDPLVDENVAYAERLRECGVPVDYRLFERMIHPFLSLGGVIDDATLAEQAIGTYLKSC